MSAPVPTKPREETFIEEMKRYLHLDENDAILLKGLLPRMEKHLPEMAERFYAQIPHHPGLAAFSLAARPR